MHLDWFFFIGLWGLVNNAGVSAFGPIEWQKLDEFKRLADVNLWGLICVTKSFLPLLRMAKGRVINFSSVGGQLKKDLVLEQEIQMSFYDTC